MHLSANLARHRVFFLTQFFSYTSNLKRDGALTTGDRFTISLTLNLISSEANNRAFNSI